MDIGQCSRYHDLALRADYEAAVKKGKSYNYEMDAMDHLERFIADCDRKTESAKKRLAEQQEDLTIEQTTKVNGIHEMAEKIGKKLAEAESVGEAGDVDKSMQLFKEVEELKAEKRRLEEDYRNTMPASTFQQQKLRVCEVCSAYLGLYDNDRRLADHFGGKLHLGFIAIRDKLEELRLSVTSKRNFRDGDMSRSREGRTNSDLEEGEEKERSRSRSRDRHRRRRSRSGSGSRKKSSRHSKSSRSSRRSRSRDRDHRRRRHRRSRSGSSSSE
ncbi:putative RNA-binding protein Luc7-like 1 isoform X2 [Symsagittifera roscoffensis]